VKSIEAGPIRISLKAATPFSKSGTNLYLRKRTKPFEYKALLGPESNSRFKIQEDAFIAEGSWPDLVIHVYWNFQKKPELAVAY